MEVTASIPNSFYVIIGTLVVTNFATIISALVFIFKAGVWKANVENATKDAKDTAVRAHRRIDNIERLGVSEESDD